LQARGTANAATINPARPALPGDALVNACSRFGHARLADPADTLTLWYFLDAELPSRDAATVAALRTGAAFAHRGARFVCLSGRVLGPPQAALAACGAPPSPRMALRAFFPVAGAPLRLWLVRRALRRLGAEIAELPGRHVLMSLGARGMALLPALAALAAELRLRLVHEAEDAPDGPAEARPGAPAALRHADALVFASAETETAVRAAFGLPQPALVLPHRVPGCAPGETGWEARGASLRAFVAALAP